jgi:hypothetical protein
VLKCRKSESKAFSRWCSTSDLSKMNTASYAVRSVTYLVVTDGVQSRVWDVAQERVVWLKEKLRRGLGAAVS